MKSDDRTRWLTQWMRATQESAQSAGPAAAASYSLIGAIVLFGGAGYAIDAWRGSAPAFLLGGLGLGLVSGFYLLAKSIWRR